MAHYCPVCGVVKIHRREVRTCGSPGCLAAWRQWTPAQKSKALDRQSEEEFDDIKVGPEELKEWITGKKEREMETEAPLDRILGGKKE